MNITVQRTVNLSEPILPEAFPAPIYEGESYAHTFALSATKAAQPIPLTGSVVGYFERADRTTVRVEGHTESGLAFLTLPPECYAVEGKCTLAIMLLNDSTQTVIYAAVGIVKNTIDGAVINGGNAIPTYDEIMAHLNRYLSADLSARVVETESGAEIILHDAVNGETRAFVKNGATGPAGPQGPEGPPGKDAAKNLVDAEGPGSIKMSGTTSARGKYAAAFGFETEASGNWAFAEGNGAKAKGSYSHAEGTSETTSEANGAHAEGIGNTASGAGSHVEGTGNTASASNAHAEGTGSTASGFCSHTEGRATKAQAPQAHAEGFYTTAASENQHVSGEWNVIDNAKKYAEIVGKGTYAQPANIRTLDWNGNAWYKGEVYVGGTGQDNPTAEKLVKKSELDEAIKNAGGGAGGSVDFATDEEVIEALAEADLLIAVADNTGVICDENENVLEW